MKNIYWTIQAVNGNNNFDTDSVEFKLYQKHYSPSDELMMAYETIEHYTDNAWKNPLYGKLYSLTLAYVYENKIRVKYITGEEKSVIQTFLNTLKNEYFSEYKLTHFGAEILLPYFGTRMDASKIRVSLVKDLNYRGLRPWNLTGFDVRDYYKGAGDYKPNLKELAYVYGIEDVDFLSPEEEFSFFKGGLLTELKESSKSEITTLVNVHRCMMGESIIEEVVFEEQVVENVEEIKPTNILKLLYDTNSFSAEVKEELNNKLNKKKLSKKDKENLFVILRGAYIQTDFINSRQDSKTTIENKEQDIRSYIETLN